VTYAAPDADRFNYDERALLAKLCVAIAGRAAEELVFGDLTTGAESDLKQLTGVARAMVVRWGMSRELGPVALDEDDGAGEDTRRIVDAEVRRLVGAAREDALTLLTEERERLDRLASVLLERETLGQAAAYRAAGLEAPGAPPAVELAR
jgi:cell division protease FtsH